MLVDFLIKIKYTEKNAVKGSVLNGISKCEGGGKEINNSYRANICF